MPGDGDSETAEEVRRLRAQIRRIVTGVVVVLVVAIVGVLVVARVAEDRAQEDKDRRTEQWIECMKRGVRVDLCPAP